MGEPDAAPVCTPVSYTHLDVYKRQVYHLTKSLDPFRPVIVNDGWEHTVSDILTLHDYEEKGQAFLERYRDHIDAILVGTLYHNRSRAAFADGFTYRGQPVIISEFGGIAYNNDDNGWGYGHKAVSYTHLDVYKRQAFWFLRSSSGCKSTFLPKFVPHPRNWSSF